MYYVMRASAPSLHRVIHDKHVATPRVMHFSAFSMDQRT